MTAIFSFAIAFFAIIGMFTVKSWELKAGKTLFRDFRFKVDKITVRLIIFLKSYMPTRGRLISKELTHNAAYHISHIALFGVHYLERKLIKIINFIKGKGVVKKDRTTSHYMKNVSLYERHPDRK
jgi:hypothetical protein